MKLLPNPNRSNVRPDAIASNVSAVDFEYWQSQGVSILCVDLDSTILPHGGSKIDQTNLAALRKQPLPIIIATNRLSASDVRKVVRELDTAAVVTAASWFRKKPSIHYFSNIIAKSGAEPGQLLMIGDRLIQDIWGANRAGLNTVMVAKFGHQPWREKLFGAIDRWAIKHFDKI